MANLERFSQFTKKIPLNWQTAAIKQLDSYSFTRAAGLSRTLSVPKWVKSKLSDDENVEINSKLLIKFAFLGGFGYISQSKYINHLLQRSYK